MRTFFRMLAVMTVVLENPVTAQLKGTPLPGGAGWFPFAPDRIFSGLTDSQYDLSFTGGYSRLPASNVKSFTK